MLLYLKDLLFYKIIKYEKKRMKIKVITEESDNQIR
jgi:hypothetical protein